MNRYVAALVREMDLWRRMSSLAPSLCGHALILNWSMGNHSARHERLDLLGALEWTIESNPATVSLDKAKLWATCVNRVSMGSIT